MTHSMETYSCQIKQTKRMSPPLAKQVGGVEAIPDERLLREMLDYCGCGVYYVDKNRRIHYWNQCAQSITGFSANEVVGSCCQDNILNHIDETGKKLCQCQCPLSATLLDGVHRTARVFLLHKDGHRTPVSVRIYPVVRDGIIVGATEYFFDETIRLNLVRNFENLYRLATLDPLVNMPNRRVLESFVANKCAEHRTMGIDFGIVMIDLDRFKSVNDRFGHVAGDHVLQQVSKSCCSVCRQSDVFGRWGGEEFMAVFAGITAEALQAIAEKMRMLVENTLVRSEGKEITVTASVGATMFREGDTEPDLFTRVDELMYQSKQKGRNCVTIG